MAIFGNYIAFYYYGDSVIIYKNILKVQKQFALGLLGINKFI